MDSRLEEKLDQIINYKDHFDTAEMGFKKLVDTLNTASEIYYSPIGGIIRRVTISWPRGCNFLVEVLFRHKTVQFIPTPAIRGTAADVGLTLDNFTETLWPNWPVRKNDAIEMYLINHDNTNSHTISAVIHIEGDGT